MKCKVCGAQNEDYLEYCENCAAPLTPDAEAPKEPSHDAPRYAAPETAGSSNSEQSPAFGFVRSPKWPKPDFNANTVSEEDIPKDYINRFNPRKAEAAASHTPAPEARSYEAPAPEAPRYSVPNFNGAEAAQDELRDNSYIPPIPAVGRQRRAPAAPEIEYDEPEYEESAPVSYDEDDDDMYDEVRPAKSKKKASLFAKSDDSYYDEDDDVLPEKSGSKRNLIFILAAAALVVIIVVFFIIFLNKNYDGNFSNFFSSVFGGSAMTKEPEIEATTTADGEDAYLINIYSKPNYTVRFVAGEFVREVAVKSDGFLPLRIPVHVWIPDEPQTESQLVITPDLTLIAPDGKETKVEFAETITIDIPAIELNVTAPTTEEMTVDSPDVSIEGSVIDNTVMIFVDTVQIGVDETGSFSSNYTLPGPGTYTLTIEARKNGYQTASKTYTLTYANAADTPATTDPSGTGAAPIVDGNIAIAFDESNSRRATTSTMTVTGTMDPEAVLSVSGVELEGEITTDAANGKFSFTVKTADVGMYPATVTATKGSAASSKTIYLEHNPDKDSYISGVHKLDYDRIVSEPNHKQGYKVTGKVVEIIQAEPYVIAKITTSKGDIVFSYYSGISSVATDDGKTYELYADPAGTDSSTGLPHMYVWFILKSSN